MGSPRGEEPRCLHGRMMAEDLDETAAAYVLGTARGQERAAIEVRLEAEPRLKARVARLQDCFSALDLAAAPEATPGGLFDRVLAAIDTAEGTLRGTITRRAGTGVWTEMAPGVMCTILYEDPVAKRRSMLVRALPGAIYQSHDHEAGYEECLVLEGDLIMEGVTLRAGDFHLAPQGSSHPAATTVSGCLLYLSAAI